MTAAATPYRLGRLDARPGPGRLLFGTCFEDAAVERNAFAPGARVFAIASAGCTAMTLAVDHDVTAVDVNPAQLDYVARRLAGAPTESGTADRILRTLRRLAVLAGWTPNVLREFLSLEEPDEQLEFWRQRLATRRLRTALHGMFGLRFLRIAYARPLLDSLPEHFDNVLLQRLERGFVRHPNRHNPYLRALLLGELPSAPVLPAGTKLHLVHAEAAEFLEHATPGSFDAFTLSNILDGAAPGEARRLRNAVLRTATPGAVVVLRSFREPARASAANRAEEDRSMLWGVVDVRPVESLSEGWDTLGDLP